MNESISVADRETRRQELVTSGTDNGRMPLIPGNAGEDYRSRWQSLQGEFVDDPQHAVQDADELVSSVIQKLSESVNSERERIKGQFPTGSDVSTEDLRQALRNYRTLLNRLLPV